MGFNVFITCLTHCLIASPLNGAVTVETRNKRAPENEMIKQVTLAKQTQPRNLWGWGGQAPPPLTLGQKAWTRPRTNGPVPGTGADAVGRPCRAVGHLVYPSPGSPISQAALPAGLGPRALWLRGGKEGGTGLEGGKSDAKEKMHFLMTQSSRIRSLLASWMPPALSLGWSPPPDASPALTQHIPLPHPASRGPLAHGESPILKGQRTSRSNSGSFPLGIPGLWSHTTCLCGSEATSWTNLRSASLRSEGYKRGPRHFCLGPLALARTASPEEPPGGSPWEALRTDPTARSGAAQTPRQGAETQSPGSAG